MSAVAAVPGSAQKRVLSPGFARFAWFVLAYNLAVIVWGAFVRATGSGAGCGEHWPTCNGVAIPRSPALETIIEFTHRASSGIDLVFVLLLFLLGWKWYPRGHRVRRGAFWSLVFVLTEALIGAGLVLFGLVAKNASLTRAVSMSAHLVNTLILVAVLALTAWWAQGRPGFKMHRQGGLRWLMLAALLGTVLLAVSGAIAALGDTLFPAKSLVEGMRQDFVPGAHFLLRLRALHPVLAVAVGTYLLLAVTFGLSFRPTRSAMRFGVALIGLVMLQLAIGAVNLMLKAPVWLQLVHLGSANLLWICLVLFSACVLAAPPMVRAGEQPAR